MCVVLGVCDVLVSKQLREHLGVTAAAVDLTTALFSMILFSSDHELVVYLNSKIHSLA